MTRIVHHSIAALTLAFSVLAVAPAALAQAMPPAFQRLDKNGDGMLTRHAAPNSESFAAADADKDGAVTPKKFVR
jgi:hypothetical protein